MAWGDEGEARRRREWIHHRAEPYLADAPEVAEAD